MEIFKNVDELAVFISKKLVAVQMDILEKKKRKVERQLRIFKLDHQNLISPTIIYLNVGGKNYTTTLITLTKRFPGSYLSRLLDGQEEAIYDRNGNIFIDRNGKIFRYILYYLRDGKIP